MDKNINSLATAVYVLNQIDIHGKQNLLNLGGAIDMIEGVIHALSETGRQENDNEIEVS